MSDILSQDEIDKLLKAFSSGELDADELKETKEPVTVKIAEAVPSGVITYVLGIRAFIPASKLALAYVDDTSSYVGQTMKAVIITVNEAEQKLVLSVKDILKDI